MIAPCFNDTVITTKCRKRIEKTKIKENPVIQLQDKIIHDAGKTNKIFFILQYIVMYFPPPSKAFDAVEILKENIVGKPVLR